MDHRMTESTSNPDKIRFRCAGCSKAYSVPAEHAGRSTKCPACGERMVVPRPEPVALPAKIPESIDMSCGLCGTRMNVPAQYIGDITGDISSRRGRVQGTDTEGDMQIIKCIVPQSEVANYSTELRSLTGGAGSYTMEISHYDPVPSNKAEAIVAAARKDDEEKDG